jgi:hypothetical protein
MGDNEPQGGDMRRLSPQRLRGEFQVSETRALLLAFFNMQLGRLRVIDAYRDAGVAHMNYTDLVILIYLFIWPGDGALAAEVVNTLELPRRTVRDSLDKLEKSGAVVRQHKRYFPTNMSADVANGLYDGWMAELRGLCDAYEAFKKAQKGNNAPTR